MIDSITTWATRIAEGLSDEQRRDLLRLVLDWVKIDADNTVRLSFAVPVDVFLSVATSTPWCIRP